MTTVGPLLERWPRFGDVLDAGADEAAFERLRRAENIGRALTQRYQSVV